MNSREPTIGDVLAELGQFREEMRQFRESMETRFNGLEKKVDDSADLVQATATGHAKRFDAIEKRLDGRPPLELV